MSSGRNGGSRISASGTFRRWRVGRGAGRLTDPPMFQMGVHPFQWRTSHLHRPAVCPHPDVIYLVQVLQGRRWHRDTRHWGAAAPVQHNSLLCEGVHGRGDDRVRVSLRGGLGFGKQAKKNSIGISAPSRAFQKIWNPIPRLPVYMRFAFGGNLADELGQ